MAINSIPLSLAPEDSSSKGPNFFWQALSVFLLTFQRVILPHATLSLVILLLTGYTTYHLFLAHFPTVVKGFLLFITLCFYAFLTFLYMLFSSGFCALHKACLLWEEFIAKLIDRVKEKALSRLDTLHEGLSKDQAKIIVTGSLKQVIQDLSPRRRHISKYLINFALICLTFAIRSVLLAKIVKFSGKTIQLSKLFAGRATLAGAIFLNLRFFSSLLLGILYLIGFTIIVGDLLFLWG